jgi:hypothetical protein
MITQAQCEGTRRALAMALGELAEAERASRLAAEVAALRRLCAVLTAALWLTREELRRDRLHRAGG